MQPHNASDPLLFLVPTSTAQRPTWCAPRNALAKALHYCCPPSCGQCGGRGCAERPELGIAHVAQAVGVPIGEQCTREVLHYMFDNESSDQEWRK